MKNTTPWSSNNAPNATAYVPVVKSTGAWVNNITKNKSQYTNNAVPTNTGWGINFPTAQLYQYDNPNIPYDSPLYFYDAMVNTNTLNQKYVTQWNNND